MSTFVTDRLREELAAMTKERDELRAMGSTDLVAEKYRLREQISGLKAELVQAQLNIVRLCAKKDNLETALREIQVQAVVNGIDGHEAVVNLINRVLGDT